MDPISPKHKKRQWYPHAESFVIESMEEKRVRLHRETPMLVSIGRQKKARGKNEERTKKETGIRLAKREQTQDQMKKKRRAEAINQRD